MNYDKFCFYNARALSTVYSEPEGSFHDQLIPEMVEKFFLPIGVDKNAVIVDMGCGPGLFMEAVRKLGYVNLNGVTMSDEDVMVCHKKGFEIFDDDMSDLSFPNESVDFIWARHSLEHSPYPLFTLYEWDRVLKPDGKMFIEVPAPDCARVHEGNPNHYSVMGSLMWVGLMEKAGFKVLSASTADINLNINGQTVPERSFAYVAQKK